MLKFDIKLVLKNFNFMEFKNIEKKWQKFWEEHPDLYKAKDDFSKQKKYVLVEFPYPSGSGLHLGHAFSFTGGDIYARVKRMQGYNVMFPMGWDAFGLPTENYAIKTKKKPQAVTKENTDMFRNQMKKLAYSFDWSREVNTSNPDYYKWTQWIFIKLFEKGLAYKKEMPINWCPSCKIGLANEEVVDGKCERCGTEVSRRNISQWVVKITDYADKLIDGLENTDFIEKVKAAQVNWIGKSEGAKVKFKIVKSRDVARYVSTESLEVFTTRPDTLYGATFMVIAPEHKIALELAQNNEEIKKYLTETRKKSDLERTELNKEKTGVFSGLYAINPINGKEIPIWISDFVLASYGTGAIMSVPAHDERDHAFARKFGLEIIPVIVPEEMEVERNKFIEDIQKNPYVEAKGALINSDKWNGIKVPNDYQLISEDIEKQGIGERSSSYHLRDWIFSRQHYWGEPIPMIYCPSCAKASAGKQNAGWQPVPETDLPVMLPEVEHYEPTDDGQSPLAKIEDFTKCICPKCGGEARRETDTMPNWAGSDWYFMRYCDSKNDKEFVNQEKWNYWGPVDIYLGGDEHNTLHLLYSRFIYLFLHDLGVLPKKIVEPYFTRFSHGVILGTDNQRMSKSHGNVIVPEVVADKYGVDVVRMYLMFMGPFNGTMAWNENTLMGVKRFLDRFEKYINEHINSKIASSHSVKVIVNKLIKGVSDDLNNLGFNTAIAKIMQAINELSSIKEEISVEDLKNLVKLIAPLAPYSAEELWSNLNNSLDEYKSVHSNDWPTAENKYLVDEKIIIPVAINGKVRGQLMSDNSESGSENEEEVIKKAKELIEISKWLEGKKIIREIYIPKKMVNIVVG